MTYVHAEFVLRIGVPDLLGGNVSTQIFLYPASHAGQNYQPRTYAYPSPAISSTGLAVGYRFPLLRPGVISLRRKIWWLLEAQRTLFDASADCFGH